MENLPPQKLKSETLNPVCRPLDPSYAERWVTTEIGKRGGLDTPGLVPHIAVTHTEYHDDMYNWHLKYAATATTERFKGGTKKDVVERVKEFYPHLLDQNAESLRTSALNTAIF